MLRTTVLPQRLTQLFADNKKSYEALVQPRQTGPELSHLHLKLRIQKDRLIAWGIQWSDRSTAAHGGDIDQSLDKAGISDLVASIMCSIRELLDEAESLQPLGPTTEVSQDWTTNNIRRLEEILKDLTTSIDTLCDLSRSKVEGPENTPLDSKSLSRETFSARSLSSTPGRISFSRKLGESSKTRAPRSPPPRRDDLTDVAFIDPSFVRLPGSHNRSSGSPPSYESVATGSDNRVIARLCPPSSRETSSGESGKQEETPVLLDYRPTVRGISGGSSPSDRSRFEELLLALLKFPTSRGDVYTGILKLTGWTSNAAETRSAFIYEVPPFEDNAELSVENLQPRSLWSFLQNGGDADSNNMPNLENRFKLAHNIASSLFQLHETNVTHRNLNSDNVLFFLSRHSLAVQERVWKTSIIRKPFLTGFNQSGSMLSVPGHQVFAGLYHHPILNEEREIAYHLAYDYYSLGLILLEIGLWMPIGKFWKTRYSLWDFKARLQAIYLKKLAHKCGEGYMNAVLACITAADKINPLDSAGTFVDTKTQLSEYREKVVVPLGRCCRMDEDAKPMVASYLSENSPNSEAPNEIPTEESHQITGKETETANDKRSSTATAVPDIADNKLVERVIRAPARIRVWSHELPSLYQNYWTSTMFPKLERILRKALSRMESYTIDLFMAGKDPDTARPTVYMECTSTSKCHRILRHLNKELRLFEIKVVTGQIVRSKAGKKKRKNAKKNNRNRDEYEQNPSVEDLNPHYQERPMCGASIGAYLNGNHLPPVTFGGAVLVDGEPFGMSVHHMLEDEEGIEEGLQDRPDLQRSMAPRNPATKSAHDPVANLTDRFNGLYPYDMSEALEEAEDTSSIGYPCSSISSSGCLPTSPPGRALYPFEIPDDSLDLDLSSSEYNADDPETDFWLSPDFETSTIDDSDEEDAYEMGDTDPILPSPSSQPLAVTQPALDDVSDGFFPSPEDVDSEHLSSHCLGHIHASSGLRRSREPDSSLIHELDWALIKLHPERLPACLSSPDPLSSSTTTVSTTCSSLQDNPLQILPSSALASRPVHAHTRSSGLFARGTILPSMRLVRMPGRVSPSHSWQVLGSFGGGGDSGAWVFDDASGDVCGHVLAYSERSGVAYIAPMDVMLRDMEKVLGGRVGLPRALPLPLPAGIERTRTGGNEMGEEVAEARECGDGGEGEVEVDAGPVDVGQGVTQTAVAMTPAAAMVTESSLGDKKGKRKSTGSEKAASTRSLRRAGGSDGKARHETPSPVLPTSPPLVLRDTKDLRRKGVNRSGGVGNIGGGGVGGNVAGRDKMASESLRAGVGRGVAARV